MEQRTISVAKAGISTVLNSRAAVIAAANPKFGSFDDQKDPQENIEFQSTILSRFDAIFIVLDERNEEKDTHLSKHVMNMHAKAAAPGAAPGTHRHSPPFVIILSSPLWPSLPSPLLRSTRWPLLIAITCHRYPCELTFLCVVAQATTCRMLRLTWRR